MNKSNITGWKDVFTFTLVQTLKNKAFIISTVILLLICLVSMPAINLITKGGRSDEEGPSLVKKVYVNNDTTLTGMDFEKFLKDERMRHIIFEAMKEDYKVISTRIEEKENESVILTVKESKDSYSLDFVKAVKGPIGKSDLKLLGEFVVRQFDTFKIEALGIKDEQLNLIQAPVTTIVSMADTNGVEITKEDTTISKSEYWFVYGLLFIVMMVNMIASTQVASSIATEKSTRVVEYLLTSIKPLALMVGKITATLLAVLLQMTSLILTIVISNKVSSYFSTGNGDSVLSRYIPKDIFQNLNIINIVVCLILFGLGMIFYATLAGLAGATVSRIEELQEGLMLFTLTNIIGSYIGIGAAATLMAAGMNGYVIFSLLFPISSPFLLPGTVLIGKASLLIIGVAIVLQIVFIILLFKFVAKVYETLILHNGNTIKLKELIKISKTV